MLAEKEKWWWTQACHFASDECRPKNDVSIYCKSIFIYYVWWTEKCDEKKIEKVKILKSNHVHNRHFNNCIMHRKKEEETNVKSELRYSTKSKNYKVKKLWHKHMEKLHVKTSSTLKPYSLKYVFINSFIHHWQQQ